MQNGLIKEFTDGYLEKLFYFCLKKTGNSTDAEDLTQDITLNVITALNKGVTPSSFSAWVWRIARNRYSVWAKEKHDRRTAISGLDVSDYEIGDNGKSALDEMIRSEQIALLRRELAFIKSDYRDIIVSYYIEDKSVREIASRLSLSESAVKQRLFRARQILKEGMELAREFGKRSYDPEEIVYTNVCTRPGTLGQPWTLMDPKLNQNIFLACYDNPMTVEELAIEMGVALPYVEDIARHLASQSLLVMNGDKYETAFPIISRDAQERLRYYYEGVMPRLVSLLTECADCLVSQYEAAGLSYYGEYQSYDEAKWMLLLNLYKGLYSLCESTPEVRLGSTERENNGIWDVLAFERYDSAPDFVGYHCQSNGFVHYRFGYAGISGRTPANLSTEETHELLLMVEGKNPDNEAVAERLTEYGYAFKSKDKYIPRVAVIRQSVTDEFARVCKKKSRGRDIDACTERQKELHGMLNELLDGINRTVRDILCDDLPESIRKNKTVVDALVGSVCTTSHTLGYIVKHALEIGWLKYDEGTTPAIGAYFKLR